MKVTDLNQHEFLKKLFSYARGKDNVMKNFKASTPAVYIRHDVDDNLDASVRMASLELDCGVVATYFILNTAPYWKPDDAVMWEKIKRIEGMGHEIAFHNNLITEFITDQKSPAENLKAILALFKKNNVNVKGTASHGDKLCYKYGYINYEVFEECHRTEFDMDFAKKTIEHPFISMKSFGLKYEAYHLARDNYYSDSGGNWKVLPTEDAMKSGITQILIHPQWWTI